MEARESFAEGDEDEAKQWRRSQIELRLLLEAAGYEGAKTMTTTEVIRDGRSYLELLKSRKARLQVEQRHLMAIVGPSLNMHLAPSQLQRSTSHRTAAAAAKLSELRKSHKIQKELSLPIAANLNYKDLFQAVAIPMAVMNNLILQDSNTSYRRLNPLCRPEEPSTNISDQHILIGGTTLLLDPSPTKLSHVRSTSVAFRRIEEDDDDHIHQGSDLHYHQFGIGDSGIDTTFWGDTIASSQQEHSSSDIAKSRQQQQSKTQTVSSGSRGRKKSKTTASTTKAVATTNDKVKNRKPASSSRRATNPNEHNFNISFGSAPIPAPKVMSFTTTRCGRSVRPRREGVS